MNVSDLMFQLIFWKKVASLGTGRPEVAEEYFDLNLCSALPVPVIHVYNRCIQYNYTE